MSARNHYRKYRQFTIESPEVLAIIAGVVRFAANYYYRVNEKGQQETIAVNRLLREQLPTSAIEASRLLTAAQTAGIIPWGTYTPPKSPKVEKPKKLAEAKTVIRSKAKLRSVEPEPEPELSGRQRFCIVQRGEFHGIFYEDTGKVEIIGRERSDAIAALRRLLKPERRTYKPPVDQIYDRAHPEA
jgi:hypothetical protein